MKNNKRVGFIAALVVVAVFPIAFFLVFDYKNKHRPTLETDKCLPIYGPKVPFNSKNYKGKGRKKKDADLKANKSKKKKDMGETKQN